MGIITSLQICPGHGLPMRPVEPAVLETDSGMVGCRHARPGSRRQVLLVAHETLEGLGLEPGTVKENITIRGIELDGLAERTRLLVGADVELWVTGPCHPCRLMDEIRDGLQEELRGRRGVLAWVKRGGMVRRGDRVEVRPPIPEEKGEDPG